MKKAFLKIFCFLLTVCIFSNGGIAMAETLITPETLAEAAGMNKDDIDLTALEEVIRRFYITEANVAYLSRDEVAEALNSILATDYMSNYLYLFGIPDVEPVPSELETEDIKRAAVFTRVETICETAFVDFEAGTIYADSASFFLTNTEEAEMIFQLEDDVREKILDKIYEFPWADAAAAKNSAESVNSSDYGIAIETKDGVSYCVFNDFGADPKWDAIHEIIALSMGDAYYKFS